MYYVVLPIHVVACLILIIVVLLQSGRSGDIASAFGGAGTQTVFGPRGTTTVLSRATTISAVVFMVTSFLLVVLSQQGPRRRSVVPDSAPARPAPMRSAAPEEAPPPAPAQQAPAPAQPAPTQPAGR